MLFQTTLFALASLASVASAQDWIDPETVPETMRDYWCDMQKTSCPAICMQNEPGTTEVNTCDPETLQYGCLCGDNKKPNMSEYSLTIPFFVCQEWGNQCVTDCADDACRSSCREDNPCGAQDPTRVNATSTASDGLEPTRSSSDDGTTIFTGTPGSNGDDQESTRGNGDSAAGTIKPHEVFPYVLSLGFAGLVFGLL